MQKKHLKAIKKYGREACEKAFELMNANAEGNSEIARRTGLKHNQVEAAANAGEAMRREG